MNTSQASTIRGFLLIAGLTTALNVRFFSVKLALFNLFVSLKAAALVARLTAIKAIQARIPFLAQFGSKRRGSSAFSKGIEIVIIIIFLAIALYVAAYTIPGALTAMATSALTSVNTGVQTLFQVVVSLIAVVALILLLIGVVRSIFT